LFSFIVYTTLYATYTDLPVNQIDLRTSLAIFCSYSFVHGVELVVFALVYVPTVPFVVFVA
jgi:hypothetical protein